MHPLFSPFVRHYIFKQAKLLNEKVPINYKDTIYQYCNGGTINGIKIYFLWTYGYGGKVLNANSAFPGIIVVNAKWAERIIFYDSDDTRNAFKITLGHELTHKDHELSALFRKKPEKYYIAKVNEVRADFGAAQKMAKSSRQSLIKSIKYKADLINKDEYESDEFHPSWSERMYYAQNYNFTKELIQKIASDNHFTDKKIINEVCEYYSDIILQD